MESLTGKIATENWRNGECLCFPFDEYAQTTALLLSFSLRFLLFGLDLLGDVRYAPCLLAHPEMLAEDPAVVKAFLAASAEGWRLACADPDAAAADLVALAKVNYG